MANVVVKLKQVRPHTWQLFLPNGNSISGQYRGQCYQVREWARIYVSSWYNFVVDDSECYEPGETNEKADRMHGEAVPGTGLPS